MVNEAALTAARFNRKAVHMYDFEVAKDKVLMGAERKSMLLTDDDKRDTAYHEAGHVLVAAKRKHSDPLHKVTIIPRGMALGVTMHLPEEDKHTVTKDYLETQLAILMGGRCAEEIFMNRMTTGAGNDIVRATELARKMVCEYGMSELGPLTYGKKEQEVFLGREIAQARDYSDDTAKQIDVAVRSSSTRATSRRTRSSRRTADIMHRDGDRSAGARDAGRGGDRAADRRARSCRRSSRRWLGRRRRYAEGAEAGRRPQAGLQRGRTDNRVIHLGMESKRQPIGCLFCFWVMGVAVPPPP